MHLVKAFLPISFAICSVLEDNVSVPVEWDLGSAPVTVCPPSATGWRFPAA